MDFIELAKSITGGSGEPFIPLGPIGTAVVEQLLEKALPPHLQPAEPVNITEQTFVETEPNNTYDEADHIGRLAPYEHVSITGHVSGSSDPHDYFDYAVTEPANIQVNMYSEGELIYSEDFAAQEAGEEFWYWAEASGNEDFDYQTSILIMPEGEWYA